MSSRAPPSIRQKLPVYKQPCLPRPRERGSSSLTYFGMRRWQCGLRERCDLAAVLITGVVGLRVADPARRLHARFLHCAERCHARDPAAVRPARQPSSSQVKEDNSPGGPEGTRTDDSAGGGSGSEPTTRWGPGGGRNRRRARGPEKTRTDNAPGARRGTELTTCPGPGGGRNGTGVGGLPLAPFRSLTWPQSLQTHRAPLPASSLHIPQAASAFQVLVLPPPAKPPAPTRCFGVSLAPAGGRGSLSGPRHQG